MRCDVLLLGALLTSSAAVAQQPVDNYSIPSKSRYNQQSYAGKRPLTRAERTNFTETSHYDDVVAFIDSLKLLGAKISTGSIGKTIEGRDLPYVIASRPLITTPAEARRSGRPVACASLAYATDRGGVSPEPWHLSYAPVAMRAQRALSVQGLREVLAASEIDGKEEVLASLAENFRRYVVDVDPPPESARLSPRLS